jgi:cell division protein FtsZ
VMPGLINLDFADIKTVMSEMGKAMMGTGEAEGEDRAMKAAEAAISNPLLDDVSMKGARGVLINITGGPDMMLFEVDQAANRVRAEVDPDANIIFGGTILENMEGRLRVSVVATGIEAESMQKATPNNVEPLRPHRRVAAATTPTPGKPDIRAHEVRATASPVHHQMETLQQELAQRAHVERVEQPMPLGTQAAPMAEEEPAPVYHTVVRTAPVRQQPQPEPEEAPKRSRFGFLGRREKKPEPARIEPVQAQRQPQRATAQIIQRGAASEPQRGADGGDDLFPEHKKDDQFEIPAFLRRQTN